MDVKFVMGFLEGYLSIDTNIDTFDTFARISILYRYLFLSILPITTGQVVYKPRVLSVSSEALMPVTAILIPAVDCVLLLHQLVIRPVTLHLM